MRKRLGYSGNIGHPNRILDKQLGWVSLEQVKFSRDSRTNKSAGPLPPPLRVLFRFALSEWKKKNNRDENASRKVYSKQQRLFIDFVNILPFLSSQHVIRLQFQHTMCFWTDIENLITRAVVFDENFSSKIYIFKAKIPLSPGNFFFLINILSKVNVIIFFFSLSQKITRYPRQKFFANFLIFLILEEVGEVVGNFETN